MLKPRIRRVLETALYVHDLDRAIAFYERVLGLRTMSRRDHMAAMEGGEGTVLLLFVPGAAERGSSFEGGWIPAHHSTGPAHFALAVDATDLDTWRNRLLTEGVEIESEVRWARGGTSIYFRDPDQHSVELATPGVWPVY